MSLFGDKAEKAAKAEKTQKVDKVAKVEKSAKVAKAAKARKAASEGKRNPAPHYSVIKSPVITEKATNNSQFNQVTFRVDRRASKPEIRRAVETLFNVKVTGVNTHNRAGKTKMVRGRKGFRSDVKFAIVTLKEGSSIDVTTGL